MKRRDEARVPESFRDAVEEALVDELYDRSRASFLGLVLVLAILRALLDDVFRRSRLVPMAFYAICALVAVRIVLVLVARRKQGFFASTTRRHVAFGIGSTATAVGFGALNVAAYPHVDAVQLATLAVCQTGINAIALVNMGSSLVAYHCYMIPNLAPMIALTAIGPHAAALRLLPVMITLFVTVLSLMAIHEHTSRRDNILLRLQVSEMALVDTLTKLRNRRYLQEFMSAEVEQVLRERDRRLWLLIVDLDHFKQVNDVHGHDAGDAVLQQAADVLRATVRKQDVVARWGGEEFVIVAREVEPTSAGDALAERIRRAIEAHRFALPGGAETSLTCSVGFSVFPFFATEPRALAWDDVLTLADAGLYRAKRQGRNRVVGVLSGEASSGRRDTIEVVKHDFDRASSSGIVRVVGA